MFSAAETAGKVKIISAPKIVTLDNKQARIVSGEKIPITVVSGPVTDNQTGTDYISRELKLPAANAKTDGRTLFGIVYEEIHKA